MGGFGEIYLCHVKNAPNEKFVMKVDNDKGPLYVEIAFVLRACQQSTINAFKEKKGLSFLGVPRFLCSGTHQAAKGNYRFLVMERLGDELQKVLKNYHLTIQVVCNIACRVIGMFQKMNFQFF